jgi:hypothetical protein
MVYKMFGINGFAPLVLIWFLPIDLARTGKAIDCHTFGANILGLEPLGGFQQMRHFRVKLVK